MTEDNVTAREYQDDHRNEEPLGRGKGSAGTKYHTIGLVGDSTRKGRTVGC